MKYLKGFSVTELLVSIAILGALSTVIVVNQQKFNKTVLLQNAAHELAILFREQQSQATNVLDDNSGASGFINDSDRGIYIDVSDLDEDDKSVNFVRFYDENSNGLYESGEGTISDQDIALNNKYVITEVCAEPEGSPIICRPARAGGQDICNDLPESMPVIVYARPLLQPKMRAIRSVPDRCVDRVYRNDRINVSELERITMKIQYRNATAPSDGSETVVIDAAGGIYVQ